MITSTRRSTLAGFVTMNRRARIASLAVLMALVVGVSVAAGRLQNSGQAEAKTATASLTGGDPRRGEALYRDERGVSCARCHRVRGQGGDIGPDLSDVGAKLDRAGLLESVTEPSRQIVEGYRTTVLALRDGRVLSGLVTGESGEELTLVDAKAEPHRVPTSEIQERAYGTTSIMPDDLVQRLSTTDLADLVAYLESLRSSGQPTPGSGVTGPVRLAEGFRAERVAAGLTGATALAIAPDGRVFVCEQTGTLRVVRDGKMLPTPFVALNVDSSWERGLIGVTLDPQFEQNGFVYVCYVAPQPYPHHRISRFTASGDVATAGSEVVLFEGDDQRTLGGKVPAGHQGGAIHFGRDGKLYVALGEQTAETPSQSLESLQGKLLRINPDGTIPPDNPFVHEAKGKYRAIWALGFRNPFTFAVQPETGRILINDVGGNFEEVNEGIRGTNYGWPVVEHGPVSDPRFRGPIFWYPTASISGAAFCGDGFGSEYCSKYFFMDFVKGWIKFLDPDDPHRPAEARTFAEGLARPVDLAFSGDGSLYVLLRDAWVRDENFRPHSGALIRIVTHSEPAGSGR